MKTSTNVRNMILLEYADMPENQDTLAKCPNCLGGKTGENSFSIVRKRDKLLWICFRDSCGIKGSAAANGRGEVPEVDRAKKKITTDRRVERATEDFKAMPREVSELIPAKYPTIIPEKTFFGWVRAFSPQNDELTDLQKGRLAMPILDWYFTTQGLVLRDLSETQSPKALTLRKTDYKGPAWACMPDGNMNDLVVVEDLISAQALVQFGIDACALLGTHVTDEIAADINNKQYKRVWVALDKDALATGTAIAVGGRLRNSLLLPLERDFKDMRENEVLEVLETIKKEDTT